MYETIMMFLILLICFSFPFIFSKLTEFVFGKSLTIGEHDEEIKKEIEENEKKIRTLKMRLSVLYALQRVVKEEEPENV